jgi:hypothetical protein
MQRRYGVGAEVEIGEQGRWAGPYVAGVRRHTLSSGVGSGSAIYDPAWNIAATSLNRCANFDKLGNNSGSLHKKVISEGTQAGAGIVESW